MGLGVMSIRGRAAYCMSSSFSQTAFLTAAEHGCGVSIGVGILGMVVGAYLDEHAEISQFIFQLAFDFADAVAHGEELVAEHDGADGERVA